MDRLQAMEVFAAVAEHGGFAAAARALSLSPPSVTRAVSALERRLGTPLLVRTTRSVRLTESGRRYLEDCRRILQEVTEAEETAAGHRATLVGELRLTAPVLFGSMYVAPIVAAFLDAWPQVRAETLFVDRPVNLIDEGQDVAVRIGDLADSSLIAVRVGAVRRVVAAAPAYLEEHGTPAHPDELARHRLIDATAVSTARTWEFWHDGKPLKTRIASQLRMNGNDAVRGLVCRGWGISRLLSYQVAPQIADGTLVPLLREFEPPPVPVHVVHPEGRMVSRKVRAFVDFAVARLRADPSVNPVQEP